MHEIALLSASISIITGLFYGNRALLRNSISDGIFALFGLTMAAHNLNLYTWLNLPAESNLIIVLRGLDYIIGIPLLLIGLYLIHMSSEARIRRPNKWVKKVLYTIPILSLPIIALSYLIIDPEIARRLAVVILIPTLGVLPLYYLNHLRNNPYRIPKPEFQRGYSLIMLGYVSLIFGTGIFAGVLRLIDLGIMMETVSVLLIASGGIVIGTVTYESMYKKLRTGVIVLDKKGTILVSKLSRFLPDAEDNAGITELAIPYFFDKIEEVFETGIEIEIPTINIEPFGMNRLFKLEAIPHELNTDGSPHSILVVLTDITYSLENLESEQLSDLFGRFKDERDKAKFYLDLLSHDIGNIMQGILFGIEMISYNKQINPDMKTAVEIVQDEVRRSMTLLADTNLMVQVSETVPKLGEINIVSHLEKAISETKNLYSNENISFQRNYNTDRINVFSEKNILAAFQSVIRFLVENCTKESKCITLNIDDTVSDTVSILFSCSHSSLTSNHKLDFFEWKTRNPSGGVGLPLVKLLVERSNGKIILNTESKAPDVRGISLSITLNRVP